MYHLNFISTVKPFLTIIQVVEYVWYYFKTAAGCELLFDIFNL